MDSVHSILIKLISQSSLQGDIVYEYFDICSLWEVSTYSSSSDPRVVMTNSEAKGIVVPSVASVQ